MSSIGEILEEFIQGLRRALLPFLIGFGVGAATPAIVGGATGQPELAKMFSIMMEFITMFLPIMLMLRLINEVVKGI